MNYFKEEISAGQPSLRVGDRIPENSVNLAYVSGPELVSADAVELYDYTNKIPMDTVVVDDFKGEFFVGPDRALISNTGSELVPIENALVTGYYKELTDGTWIPMYYKYASRYKHYEKDPPLTTDNAPNINERIYLGHNIRVLCNDKPADGNYIITLQQNGPAGDYTWKVRVYSEFTSSKDLWYVLEYSKWNSANSIIHNFEELYNSEPTYAKTDNTTILSAADGEQLYSLEKVSTEDGYRVYVAEDDDPLTRDPVLFRWRIIDNNGARSSWQSDILYRIQSMYDEDFVSPYDKYILEDDIAKKILCNNVGKLFQQEFPPYTEEHQVWNGAAWVADETTKANLDINATGRLSAYTTFNTGDKIEQPGIISKEYPRTSVEFTVEGWLDPLQVTPARTTNVTKSKYGATVSSDLNTGQFTATSVNNCIDGTNPFWFLKIAPLSGGIYSARSSESSNPPIAQALIDITLPQAKSIHKIEVVLGSRGKVVKLEVRKSDNSVQTIWANASAVPSVSRPPSILHSGRYFVWNSGDYTGIADVTHIYVTVETSKWITKDYGWFINWLGIRDKYQTGFDVYEINAYNTVDPPDIEWNKKDTIPVTISKASQASFDVESLLRDNGFVPEGVTQSNLFYRITLGDVDDGSEYNPYISMMLFKNNLRVAGEGITNSIKFRFNDFNGTAMNIKLTAQQEDTLYSKRFSVKTSGEGRIFIERFEDMNRDEMWLPKINNGRMTRKNYIEDTFLDYYLPEYGAQPFYPNQPYMYVVREQAEYVDGSTIKIGKTPMYVTYDANGELTNLNVYIESDEAATPVTTPIEVINWNMYTGEIKVNRKLSFTDNIYVDYYYNCQYLIYKGWADVDASRFYTLDFNPMPGHVYMDDNGVMKDSSELMEKSVYFYLLPTYTSNGFGAPYGSIRHKVFTRETSESVAINSILALPECQGAGVIILGRIDAKRPAIPRMIEVTDSRRRGGGFKDMYSPAAIDNIHPEAAFIWDIGAWDGLPYPSNGVIEVTVPRYLLNDGKFTEKEILDIINKHIAFGVYVFIQYK
jgi:hypothetical protein